MFRSMRTRIALPFFILIVLLMVGLFIYLSSLIRTIYIDSLESELTSEARLIASSLSGQDTALNRTPKLDNQVAVWASVLNERITIIAADGTVIGESQEDIATMDNHLSRPEIQQAFHQPAGTSIRYSQTAGYNMLYVAVPVMSEKAYAGFVRVSLPLQTVEQNIRRFQTALIGITLGSALAAILLSFVIADRTTKPLRAITETAQRISLQDLDQTIETRSADETGILANAFNRMVRKLDDQYQVQRTERTKLVAVLEHMTEGILIVDGDSRVELINPAAEGIFSLKAEHVIERTLAEVLRSHQISGIWQESVKTGQRKAVEMELLPRRMYLYVTAAPLGEALPGRTLITIQDLTRLRQLETVRQDFVSNISHELRTPLASLKALSETLQEGALEDPPAARRFLGRIDQEVDALTQLVAELLELARIESGKVPLQIAEVDPCEILQRASGRLQVQADRGGVEVRIDCTESRQRIQVDAQRMEQVVVNLVHNAIKFTPAGGKITLAAQQKDDTCLISVTDTGTGISERDLPRIFERFYKSDRARSGGGTGLGLAIARHLVEAHGGKIRVESTEGQGSTFTIELPCGTSTP